VCVVHTAIFRLVRPHEPWSWAAIGGVMVAVAVVGALLLVGKPRSRRRRAAGAVLLVALVPLDLADRGARRSDPVWEHLKAEIRHDIAHRCPGERGVQARAIFETWARSQRPTTIDCAPTHEVGTYGNGLRLSVSIAGRIDPACTEPQDTTYWVGGPKLVLHWCEPAGA
jgi:hypothetical protein